MSKNRQKNSWQWDDIRYFLAITEHGSLSGAARALNVKHSTVSRHLIGLETGLGTKLFIRLGTKLELSQDGQLILKRAKLIEREMLAVDLMAQQKEMSAGHVTLSCPPMLLRQLILPCFKDFFNSNGNIELVLQADARTVDMSRNEADIALRFVRPTEEDLICRTLATLSYSVYGTNKWMDVEHEDHKFIRLSRIKNLENNTKFTHFVGNRQYSMTTNDIDTAKEACMLGYGLVLLPDIFVPESMGLMKFQSPDMVINQKIFMVMHADVRNTRQVRLVADYLVESVKKVWLSNDY